MRPGQWWDSRRGSSHGNPNIASTSYRRNQGLQYPVHQMGVSSGTLRMLALMTALLSEPEANLVGIEEPENYVHPERLCRPLSSIFWPPRERVQFMVTTHSPLLLDYVNEPEAVRIVQRRDPEGTAVISQESSGRGYEGR